MPLFNDFFAWLSKPFAETPPPPHALQIAEQYRYTLLWKKNGELGYLSMSEDSSIYKISFCRDQRDDAILAVTVKSEHYQRLLDAFDKEGIRMNQPPSSVPPETKFTVVALKNIEKFLAIIARYEPTFHEIQHDVYKHFNLVPPMEEPESVTAGNWGDDSSVATFARDVVESCPSYFDPEAREKIGRGQPLTLQWAAASQSENLLDVCPANHSITPLLPRLGR